MRFYAGVSPTLRFTLPCPLCPSSDADLRRRQLRQADVAISPPLPAGKPPALDDEPDASYYGEGEDAYRCVPPLLFFVLLLHVGVRCSSLAAFLRSQGTGPAHWGQHCAM